jgi:recombination protein RecR
MNTIQKLIEIFSHFPGIGPRQARRFVYYLLSRNQSAIDELVQNLTSLKQEIAVCSECMRFFEQRNPKNPLCSICSDQNRDTNVLMIVPRDTDLESIEKSGAFSGKYFILGGTVPILEKEPEKRVRVKELLNLIERKFLSPSSEDFGGPKEVILAMNATPEGENTENYIRNLLTPVLPSPIKISVLGRGISTGLELEYADKDTVKYALQNRS